ncbi:hypothetical protein IVB15_12415 [Bradyrhizobium sp. 182]|uniref:hypothetical protein n=1 Tax=unclassified Bradyrhizobium TaxID=2631580 RepID=UPI001FFA5893|nr:MULTISPECIES: hypothetical protein [unclassified Bradyrhizobium]MCK1420762.1 hypothetical protein [Bradyrhizobium sp. CW12]MCK1528499.1 hypothetical protein [Bradyrhizobium sp. 182]MCK1643368.1 hypothetical protein [Bradyrhizobium sp. 154]
MSRTSTLLKGLHSMLARLTDGTFDDPSWALEDTYEVFRVIPEIERSKVTVYSLQRQNQSAAPASGRHGAPGVQSNAVIDGNSLGSERMGFRIFTASKRSRHEASFCTAFPT